MLVRDHPWLQVHVSEIGAPHLVDPSKLEASARRLYGTAFDALWGELVPVPSANVNVVEDDVARPRVLPDPRPRLSPRLIPGGGRHPLRGRRRGRTHRTRWLRASALPPAGVRSRCLGANDRRDRAADAGAARSHPLRRLRRRRGPPRRASREARPLVAARGGRDGRADVRRSRPLRRLADRTPSWSTSTTGRRRTGITTAASSGTGASGARR